MKVCNLILEHTLSQPRSPQCESTESVRTQRAQGDFGPKKKEVPSEYQNLRSACDRPTAVVINKTL
jgi:hypothetical protein